LELADVLAVNKADGASLPAARTALRELKAAMRYLRPRNPEWAVEALTVSALTGDGLPDLWAAVLAHRVALTETGTLSVQRGEQQRRWMWAMIEERLMGAFRASPLVRAHIDELEAAVDAGETTPSRAANALLSQFGVD
jgi:LAO/AO transport system kinase